MAIDLEKVRADFEAWYMPYLYTGPNPPSSWIQRDEDGKYVEHKAQVAFDAYQAGRAALQPQPATLDMEDIEYELRNMASTMYEFSMSFGVGQESFERMANDVFSYARSVLQSQFDEETKHLRDALWIAERKLDALQSQDREDAERLDFLSSVTMPEPVAQQIRYLDSNELSRTYGRWSDWQMFTGKYERMGANQKRSLVTTDQAEAYAAAKVRDAMELLKRGKDKPKLFSQAQLEPSNSGAPGSLTANDCPTGKRK